MIHAQTQAVELKANRSWLMIVSLAIISVFLPRGTQLMIVLNGLVKVGSYIDLGGSSNTLLSPRHLFPHVLLLKVKICRPHPVWLCEL